LEGLRLNVNQVGLKVPFLPDLLSFCALINYSYIGALMNLKEFERSLRKTEDLRVYACNESFPCFSLRLIMRLLYNSDIGALHVVQWFEDSIRKKVDIPLSVCVGLISALISKSYLLSLLSPCAMLRHVR
jgi:hypothetical protein